MEKLYGYMRVSSVSQNEERQRIDLVRFGVKNSNIFMDKLSGKDFNRPAYQQLKNKLQENDVLVIKSIDRLGRNYEEIQNEWRYIVNEIKADIVVIDMPLLDTRTNKDLMGTLISDIVLQLLSFVAQSERENIKQRQAEGIAAARARGVHLGRYASPIPETFYPIYQQWCAKKFNRQEAARQMGITIHQFTWLVRKYRKQDIS